MYKKILVPLDGTPLAEWALPAALAIARRECAQLELIKVEELAALAVAAAGTTSEGFRLRYDRDFEPALAYFSNLAERIARVHSAPIRQTVQLGVEDPGHQLAEHARVTDTDLIVMATHGYGRWKRFWLGSVSDSVVRSGRSATLLLRSVDDKVDLEAEPTFQNILVPLDGSDESEAILAHAIAVGGNDADYTLITVVPTLAGFNTFDFTNAPPPIDRQTWRSHLDAAQAMLDAVAERLWRDNQRLRVRTAVVSAIEAGKAIIDWSVEHGNDLIAMATHGRGGAARAVLGSVADTVARETNKPLLLWRPVDGSGE